MYLPTDKHLGCFYLLAIMNSADINTHVKKIFVDICFHFFYRNEPWVICDYMFNHLRKYQRLFTRMVSTFYIIINVLGFQLISLWTLAIIWFFYFSHFSGYEEVSHCVSLIYIFWWLMMLSIFYVFIGHLYIFLWDMSIQILCSLF